MRVVMIAALNNKSVIGKNNGIPWHSPEDFRHFKEETLGCPCIMGRKTFESLPKPLPGRLNIVLTRQDTPVSHHEDVVQFDNPLKALVEAMTYAVDHDSLKVVIMGGEQIYTKYMSIANELILSYIDDNQDGDAYFPSIDEKEWVVIEEKRLSNQVNMVRYGRRVEQDSGWWTRPLESIA